MQRDSESSAIAVAAPAGLLAVIIMVSTAGCGSGKKQPPQPLQPPPLNSTVSYRPGTPISVAGVLSAATMPTGAFAPDEALAARVTWVALSRAPQGLRPILSDATLIAAPRSSDPFLAAGRLTRGAQIVPATADAELSGLLAKIERGAFGEHSTIATTRGALPQGVTLTFALTDESARQRIELDLHRPPRPALAAATTGTAPTSATPATTETAATPSDAIELSLALDDAAAQRERVLLAPQPMPPPARFALVVPSQWVATAPRVRAIVAIVELQQPLPDSSEHQRAVAACAQELQRLAAGTARGAAATAAPAGGAGAVGRFGLAAALRSMNRPETARAAMVYLGSETGAELFGDIVLVADDEALGALSNRVRERVGGRSEAVDPAQLGWQLDVAALEHLSAIQAAEAMPPELAGVLARYAGEAARSAGSLEELTRVKGREQLRARLIAENFTYLEDASPAARVRAYDWLGSRGRAPANYDPLGSAKERAAAIDAAITTTAAAAAAATTPEVPAAASIQGAAGGNP